MSITPEQIANTAKLARLQIDQSEVGEITTRINAILSLVDEMQAIDTSSVTPMANALDAVQVLRPDSISEPVEAQEKIDRRDQYQTIAPATEDGLYLVPKVIE